MLFDRRLYKNFDKALLLIVIALLLIGLAAVYSATQAKHLPFKESFYCRQMTWMAIGLLLLVVMVNVSYQKFIDLSYMLYAVNIGLLILVLAVGHARLGAQRWFTIGSFAFQPSEFIKLTFILSLANYIGSNRGSMASVTNFIVAALLLAMPFVLVLLQPDLGTALLLVPIFFGVLLVTGANLRYIVGTIIAGIIAMPFFWHFLRDYQKQRLLVFINPNVDPLGAGYTIIQSKIAIGSGGLMGKGWLAGTQAQLNFIPEHHTDFIFSVIGEEFGYLGTATLLLLYYLLVRRAFTIAALTSDVYGRVIAIGVAILLSFQVLINMGMTVGLMPVVGIPLPLISYGGSSLITTLIAIGLLLNVSMRRSTF